MQETNRTRTSANDRRLNFIKDCTEQKIDWEITCDITEHVPGKYVVVAASVKRGPDMVRVHKMKYAESSLDDSYISWAETMAISKAISFLLTDQSDTVHSVEEFEELVRRKLLEMDGVIAISGSLEEWFGKIADTDLREAIRPVYERLTSRSIVSEATKKTKSNGGANFFDQ